MSNQNNAHMVKASLLKDDEFYTQMSDIENELKHYNKHLRGKTIYCNCDDYRWSNFPKYFIDNFHELQLKKLIVTGLNAPSYEYDGKKDVIKNLVWLGNFDSPECIEYLKECDVVVSNPPFSLFRKYVAILMWAKKDFIIIGNSLAYTYKEIFPLVQNKKVYIQNRNITGFIRPDGSIGYPQTNWFTTFNVPRSFKPLKLTAKYDPNKYPKYLNYDAIHIDSVNDIPYDYYGEMAVPITYAFRHHDDNEFELIGISRRVIKKPYILNGKKHNPKSVEDIILPNGKSPFMRVIIKRIQSERGKPYPR